MSNSFSFAVYNLKIAAKYERGFDVTYVYMPKTLCFYFTFWQTDKLKFRHARSHTVVITEVCVNSSDGVLSVCMFLLEAGQSHTLWALKGEGDVMLNETFSAGGI